MSSARPRVALALLLAVACLGPAVHATALATRDRCGAVPARLSALGLKAIARTLPNGNSLTLWRGHVASWDGVPLAVDVTTPAAGCDVPLVSLNHGYGGSRKTYEVNPSTGFVSNPWFSEWNNVWFAAKGDAALNVTARGFFDSCGRSSSSDGSVRGLPAACTAHHRHYWIQLDDMRYNARDIQWVIGRLVDAGLVDPGRIAASGGSMGGALTWELAVLNDRIACGAGYDRAGPDPCHGRTSGLAPWRSPAGVPLHIAAAVPMFSWGSLATLLMPNGRAAKGLAAAPTSGSETTPVGVPLKSLIDSLRRTGRTHGFFEPANMRTSGPSWGSWFAALHQPVTTTTTRPGTALGRTLQTAFSRWRSMNSPTSPEVPFDARVPVLEIQGMDDAVATPILAQQMWAKAKAYRSDYPIGAIYADAGHAPSTNAPAVVVAILARANAFLDYELTRQGSAPVLDTTAIAYRCGDVGPSIELHAPNLRLLHTGALTFRSDTSQRTSNRGGGPEAQGLNPAMPLTCPVMPLQQDPGVASWTWPVTRVSLLAGSPVVTANVRSTGRDAELNTRLWDVSPTGTQTLVSHGTYRLIATSAREVQTLTWALPLSCWPVAPGDRLKLEITGYDAPTYQPDPVPATITIDSVSLHLPTHSIRSAVQLPDLPIRLH